MYARLLHAAQIVAYIISGPCSVIQLCPSFLSHW